MQPKKLKRVIYILKKKHLNAISPTYETNLTSAPIFKTTYIISKHICMNIIMNES